MKIQLEHRISSCPDQLTCVACTRLFPVGQIRQLLKDHRSLVQGDICSVCTHRSSGEIQRLLTANGLERMLSADLIDRERGQELLELAQEAVQFPSFWQWLSKKIEILAAETNELEKARFKTAPAVSSCRRLQSLEYMYEESETR
jgi:hypothetical protein